MDVDPFERSAPDPAMPWRVGLGVLLVLAGAVIVGFVLFRANAFLEDRWTPGLEARLARTAEEIGRTEGENAGAAALVAVPLVILLGLSVIAAIGGRLLTAGVSLLQPDWTRALARLHRLIVTRSPRA